MTESFKIEKNIKIPEKRSRSEKFYPWLDMKIGESIVVEGKVAVSSARGSFRRYQRMMQIPQDWIVVQRRVEGTKESYRMWIGIKKDH